MIKNDKKLNQRNNQINRCQGQRKKEEMMKKNKIKITFGKGNN